MPALLQRFPVGRVSLTPSFTEKPSPGVVEMMSALHGASLPTRIVTAGDRMSCGEVGFDVLHPPLVGPPGPENNRSMVLMIHYQGTTVLLTGDLDAEGRTQLLSGPRRITDVLMAPHHGGKSANPPSLVDWCRPDLVIACQGANDRTGGVQQMYETMGCRYIGTWPHGATTLTIGRHGFDCETFRDRRRWPMRGLEYSTRPGAIR